MKKKILAFGVALSVMLGMAEEDAEEENGETIDVDSTEKV